MRAPVVAVCSLVVAAPAAAEHEHGPMLLGTEASTFVAGIALVAASYETMYYGGTYEGAVPSLRWLRDRFSVTANMPMYRLVGNGRTTFGIGDALVHAQATLVGDRTRAAGVVLALGIPTGASRPGLGMGHAMIMPAVFATMTTGAFKLAGSVGYGRAINSGEHDDHGTWPLVDPMTSSEVTFTATAEVSFADAWQVGARTSGAIATSDEQSRLIGGGRAGWTAGRWQTGVEVQAGLVGDPFRVRGLVQTAVRF